jgi:hypothetical protein
LELPLLFSGQTTWQAFSHSLGGMPIGRKPESLPAGGNCPPSLLSTAYKMATICMAHMQTPPGVHRIDLTIHRIVAMVV